MANGNGCLRRTILVIKGRRRIIPQFKIGVRSQDLPAADQRLYMGQGAQEYLIVLVGFKPGRSQCHESHIVVHDQPSNLLRVIHLFFRSHHDSGPIQKGNDALQKKCVKPYIADRQYCPLWVQILNRLF